MTSGDSEALAAELRRASEELLRANSLLTGIIDSSPTVILALDRELKVILWNPAAERTFGYARQEVLGRRHPVVPDDQTAAFERLMARVMAGEQIRGVTVERARKDGARLELSVSGGPLYDGGGLRGAVFVVEDVTELRRVERQLVQAQKLEALGQLTGGVAHDFNNVLQVVLGVSDVLAASLAEDTKRLELVQLAQGAAERGATLTRQLLAFSRRQPLEAAAVDANEAVSAVERMLRRTIGEQIDVVSRLAPGLPKAFIDVHQLESALLNLGVNARDAMPSGGRITMETTLAELDQRYAAGRADVTPGQYVCIAVSDEGTGMAPGVVARAFEPFFTTKAKDKGTGLGLSMVYGFLKQSGGHVAIYSELGHGTTVRLYLPLAEPAAAPEAAAAAAASPRARAGETVLLVEDEQGVREFAIVQLEALGYHVLAAEDAPTAAALLAQHEVDLLFTDIVLPGGVHGWDLATVAQQARPGLKVLFASGYSEALVERGGALKPGVTLLTKPYRAADLARRLRETLDSD